jgi:hypothetical protein
MSILKTELTTDPFNLGYAAWLPDSPGTVADMINAKNFSMSKTLMVSEIDVIGLHPDGVVAGDEVLAKLETFSQANEPLSRVVSRALKAIYQPSGLDVGSTSVQNMLTTLAAENVLTIDEAAKLKSIADQPASRGELLGIGPVSIQQIIEAIGEI